MAYSRESQDRIKKIDDLKKAWVVVYANNFHGKQDISEVRKKESEVQDAEVLMEKWAEKKFKTAGRIMLSRSMGKLVFDTIRDHSGDLQICFMKWNVRFNTGKDVVEEIEVWWENKTAFKLAEKYAQVGDYIGVEWDLFLTKHGELTLFVNEFQILAKAVRPLPEKFHGVQDIETIYRQRYLDLIMNESSFQRFKLRSKFVKTLRDFYHGNDFIEIETPVLGNAASWAAAAPFITHHNDFDEDFFLRISPETSLKKATVWRFERVVEFAKDFRNEWSDPSHMQEFTMIEHYTVWWNFEDNMKFTEDMFDYVFDNIPELSREVKVKDKNGIEKEVSFATPWKRIDYIAGVKEQSGIDVSQYGPEDEAALRSKIKEAWYTWEWIDQQVTATMIDYLYKKVLRPGIVWPAFVYNYPKTMQPLARQSDNNPEIVEQWQLVINGWEVIKAYSELVDPKVQTENFEAQWDALAKWDEEATSSDDDFVLAMEYGMPPQSGWGMGIDRIFAVLTEQENLRDVVLFPLMKSDTNEEKKKTTNIAVIILNKSSHLEPWQELNATAHLAASFAARKWKMLFDVPTSQSSDGVQILMNIGDAIIIKTSENNKEIEDIQKIANSESIENFPFTRAMLESSDDVKVDASHKSKNYNDIEKLGTILYWERKHLERITKHLDMYS